jgi:hypothetical protein
MQKRFELWLIQAGLPPGLQSRDIKDPIFVRGSAPCRWLTYGLIKNQQLPDATREPGFAPSGFLRSLLIVKT